NSTHNSSGTNRSTRSVMHGSTSDHTIRNGVLATNTPDYALNCAFCRLDESLWKPSGSALSRIRR
ncbi:hypothetical protein ACH4CC_36620, partial [Streptomyces lydicus]|uniref:hypothetical protein n=1 Tax=Streptomyces lydicus TaxID=47763 RepID=UPI0037971CD0